MLVPETEFDALARNLASRVAAGDRLVSSLLLHTELYCAAWRRAALDPGAVRTVLDSVALIDVLRDDLLHAAFSAWGLRSADAIHLATALRLDVDQIVAYDQEFCAAAEKAGLRAVSPA